MKRIVAVAVPLVMLTVVGLFALGIVSPGPLAIQAAGTSPDQAEQAALKAIPGTVIEQAQLEDENGQQVYGVIIKASDGSGLWDVKVDAATGRVISTESDDGSEGPDNESGDSKDGD